MMGKDQTHRLHAFIEGLVQGVSFRYFVLKVAKAQNLAGWVRNRYDGRVEVVAEGNLGALNHLLAELRKGPISAQVEKVDYTFSEARGEFRGFKILSTA